MYKYTIVLILFFYFLFSCDKSEKKAEIELIRNDSLYVLRTDSTVRLSVPLRNGKMNGQAFFYDSTGKIIALKMYVNDTAQGYACEYYSSGVMKKEWHNFRGKMFGEVLEYHDKFQDSIPKFMNGIGGFHRFQLDLKDSLSTT